MYSTKRNNLIDTSLRACVVPGRCPWFILIAAVLVASRPYAAESAFISVDSRDARLAQASEREQAGSTSDSFRNSVVEIFASSDDGSRYVGRGIIVDESGYIVANYHSVLLTNAISAKLANGESRPGKIIYYNENYDICIFKIAASGLTKIALGDSDLVYIGQPVFVLGKGDIAKAARTEAVLSEIKYFNNFRWFTFSAPLSKEDSGTPLYNAQAQLIGIVTFVKDDSKCYAFASNQIGKYLNNPQSVPPKEPSIESLSKANLYFIEGYKYSLFGAHAQALKAYQKVLELNPQSALTYNNLGNAYEALGDHAQAISSYRKGIAIDPGIGEVYFNLANTYAAAGNKLQAIAMYEKALAVNGNLVEASFNLGNVLYEAGKHQQAIAYYEKAVSTDPYFPEVYYNLGNAYYAQGQFAQAVSNYDKAAKINPNNAFVFLNLARAYYALGLYKDSKGNFIRAKKVFNNQKDFQNVRLVDGYLKRFPQ